MDTPRRVISVLYSLNESINIDINIPGQDERDKNMITHLAQIILALPHLLLELCQ